MPGEIEITVGDVNDVEARVYAHYREAVANAAVSDSGTEPIILHGTLRGPNCEMAHTLPAVFMFRGVASAAEPTAEAIVSDPCVWSPELPHLYQADVVAQQGKRIVAEFHGPIGFRRGNDST
ncbi:MAG: hypothetical protein L0228_08650 [Planctomycetes bacterium]|nr:hypothetical protein [Planctomycetota bacterium]